MLLEKNCSRYIYLALIQNLTAFSEKACHLLIGRAQPQYSLNFSELS